MKEGTNILHSFFQLFVVLTNGMKRIVELVAHNPVWRVMFEEEAVRLTAVFQPILRAIHHIGSTAVPGILAKPIIDVLVEVGEITAVDKYYPAMAALGYIAKGENGIPGRRYFRKGSDAHHTHHVHVFQTGHPEIARHLHFRDYLIAHPETAQAYSRLKTQLAREFREDPAAYTRAKTEFILAVDKVAGKKEL